LVFEKYYKNGQTVLQKGLFQKSADDLKKELPKEATKSKSGLFDFGDGKPMQEEEDDVATASD